MSLGDPGKARRLLEGAGFTAVDATGIERPMWFGDDADDAAGFIAGQFGGFLDALEPDQRPRARSTCVP